MEALVEASPDSALVPQAWLQIGRYWWEDENYYKALLAYNKVVDPDSPIYSYAVFQLARCFYHVGEYGKSIATLKEVVTYEQGTPHPEAPSLTERALAELTIIYGDAGEPDTAIAYFRELGRPDLIEGMLLRLGRMLVVHDGIPEAIETYERLVELTPEDGRRRPWRDELDTLKRR